MSMSAIKSGRKGLCVAGLLLHCLILLKCSVITVTITTPLREGEYNNNTNSTPTEFMTLRGIGRTIAQCLTATEQWKCFEEQLNRYIDVVAQDNSTWQLGDYIFVERLTGSSGSERHVEEQAKKQRVQHQRSFLTKDTHANAEQDIGGRLLQLAKSRSIRFKLPSSKQTLKRIGAGISDVIDGLALENIAPAAATTTEAAQADEGTDRILNGLVDDKLEKVVNKLTVLSSSGSNSNNFDETIHLQNDKDKLILDKDKKKIKNKLKDQNKIIKKLKKIIKKEMDKLKDKDKNKKKKHKNKNKYKDKDKDKNKNKNKDKNKCKNKFKHKYKDKTKYKKKKKIKEGLFVYETSLKARKKKGKDKNMAMMGGMAMVAMIAQMFLGKMILIAGAAFVMAKIALIVSVIGSLKKGSIGSSGSTTERIVVTGQTHASNGGGGHSGHSYESGWHRRMPHLHAGTEIMSEEPHFAETYTHNAHKTPPQQPKPGASHQQQAYYINEINEEADDGFKRRQMKGEFL